MVRVNIADGALEGEVVENEYGGTYCSFKGIPYAQPPVGDLRFKAPKPIKPWSGVRSAKEFGPMCYQTDLFKKTAPAGSEDCLYINVYTPSLQPSSPLPVMVWIHGGGYIWGSGNDNMYGPEFLVRQDVILVTFNYRLGVLGFLCLDTEEIPGNAGMKDQVLALRWVQKNISQFGGDPKNVTIFGESAGGTSVGYQLASPMSKGLFKRAILQSGSLVSYWAKPFAPREIGLALARKLECYSEDDKELYEFFKAQPMENLINITAHATLTRKPYQLCFGIVDEKQFGNNERFFHGDQFDIMRNNIDKDVEVIAGYTEHEGVLAFGPLDPEEFSGDANNLFSFINNHIEYFVPKQMAIECPLKEQFEIARKMKQFYMKNKVASKDNIDEILRFINLDFFSFEVISFAKFYAKKAKTYLYKFTCKSERNQMTNIFGLKDLFKDSMVCHADDLPYLFPVKIIDQKIEKDSETFKLIDNVTTLWTNFAKYGNPTPDDSKGVKWMPFSVEKQDYLDIGNDLVSSTHPEREDVAFWESLYKEYLPRCIV